MPQNLYGNRLLVIDDDPRFGRVMRRAAEQSGFEVLVAEDARLVVNTARCWHPTVIMLDLQMPNIDGIEVLRALAADQNAAHLVLTSGAEVKVLESAMQLGRDRGMKMAGVLHKPIRIEVVQELLAGFMSIPKTLLAADLVTAIVADQLFLEYQPKFDCRLARFAGVEALVRWHHPTLGTIQPDQFIPLAEESNLIHRLTDWVIRTAARQCAAWRAGGMDLDMAVNISAKDLEDLHLPDRLYQQCADAGITPASMTLELTETGEMREAVQMMDVLTRLRLKGFRLSIDDFGTGYSSLGQLQKMPFSEIKIDRSFVMRMTSNDGCKVIAGIVIELARRLGLKCVAEGVEEEAALTALTEMGCDMAQGYHMSGPVAPERVPEIVNAQDALKAAA
jgi:EAL domain-containing protein (putative c-di-GMP-specific phosphodiesterase class I)/ActR/RegA family two-component response regulator